MYHFLWSIGLLPHSEWEFTQTLILVAWLIIPLSFYKELHTSSFCIPGSSRSVSKFTLVTHEDIFEATDWTGKFLFLLFNLVNDNFVAGLLYSIGTPYLYPVIILVPDCPRQWIKPNSKTMQLCSTIIDLQTSCKPKKPRDTFENSRGFRKIM